MHLTSSGSNRRAVSARMRSLARRTARSEGQRAQKYLPLRVKPSLPGDGRSPSYADIGITSVMPTSALCRPRLNTPVHLGEIG